ncbi:hypothetical protein HBI67_202860 [Parastagonospora nodorum]|nr:hypothetical protein HBI67_202860 [Parastagonospora nodorum]KAH6063634.1 hypothetical protein HBI66_175080 [Parastagonospora nodorum]KAH6390952.1 hypothetical protein HBI60_173730 [Parastagonospora nodorum]
MRDIFVLEQSCNVDYDNAVDLGDGFRGCATSPVAEAESASSEVAVYGGDEDLGQIALGAREYPSGRPSSRFLAGSISSCSRRPMLPSTVRPRETVACAIRAVFQHLLISACQLRDNWRRVSSREKQCKAITHMNRGARGGRIADRLWRLAMVFLLDLRKGPAARILRISHEVELGRSRSSVACVFSSTRMVVQDQVR